MRQQLKLTFFGILLIFSFNTTVGQISSNDLELSYPFNSSALDESGNNFDGTVNGVSITADRFGNPDAAYDFAGSSSYIEIPANSTLRPNFPFTVSLWVKIDSFDPIYSKALYGSDEVPGIYSGFWVNYIPSGQVVAGYGDGAGNNNQHRINKFSNTLLGTSQWHHIVAVFNGLNDIDLYIDCEEDPGYDEGFGDPMVVLGTNGTIGRNLGHGTTSYHDGQIDDVRFYSRAMDEEEVQFLCYETPCTSTVIDTVTVYNYVSVTDTLIMDVDVNGISGATNNTILVYPNPTTDILFINTGDYGIMTDHSIRITTSTGSLVYQTNLTQQFFQVDLNTFGGPGLYFVEILAPNSQAILTRHIVLQ